MTLDIKKYIRTYYKCQWQEGSKENNQKYTIILINIFEQ